MKKQMSIGSITIKGSNRPIKIEYAKPKWTNEEECEPYFRFQNQRMYLSQFFNPPRDLAEYSGIHSDTYFSGVLIKFGDKDNNYQDECIRAFTYYS